ncbi:MAG: hypothetical protein QOF98_741 [Streptomyces sp.]|nr:hypothetical protein [Streptomyces sp.]
MPFPNWPDAAQPPSPPREPFSPDNGPAATDWLRSSQQNRRLALLNDEPVGDAEQDVLGARETAARLSALLRASHGSTPFTLAIDAGWGMGKSSLMRLVDIGLRDRRPQIRTVWYNAWTASGSDALEGLIKSVLISLDPNVLRRGLRNLSQHGRLVRALRTVLMAVAGLLHAAGPINELWDRMSVDARTRNEMRDVMRDLVTDWVKSAAPDTGGRMLVVFIDDLDRCSEETVMAVCEALKLYLDVPGLAFVIGCDRAALAPNGLLRDASPAAAAFLEKIFQTSYRVPIAGDEGIEAYVRHCAATAGIGAFLDEDLTRLLIERSGRNPRRIKRLVNGFVLEATLNPVWRDFTAEAVVRVLLLQYFYGDFSRMMTTPGAAGDRDVVTEFRDYRRLRQVLGGGGPLTEEQRTTVVTALRTYELPVPPAAADLDVGTLQALERELPVGFPQLAADRGFVSLVEELMALDEADELVRRLRRAAPRRPAGPPITEVPPVPPPAGYGREGYGPPQSGGSGFPQQGYPQPEYEAAPLPVPSGQWYTQQPAQPSPGPAEPAESDEDSDQGSSRTSYRRIPDARRFPQAPAPLQESSGPPTGQFTPDPYGYDPMGGSGGPYGYGQAPQSVDPYGYDTGSPAPRPAPYAGLGLLWVTQNPAQAAPWTSELISHGAVVRLVGSFLHVNRPGLREVPPDLLVVDINWPGERQSGLAFVEVLRDSGDYTGPVIFVASRVTPSLKDRSVAVGGLGVVADPEAVVRLIEKSLALNEIHRGTVATSRRPPWSLSPSAPTDPPTPGSGAPRP